MSKMLETVDHMREDWGAPPSFPDEVAMDYWQGVEVHHGGVVTGSKDPFVVLPNVRDYQMNRLGYRDIWYQMAIGEDGDIFEARGWHVKNSAKTHLTVLVCGDYHHPASTPPNDAQLAAIELVRTAVYQDGGGQELTWHQKNAALRGDPPTSCPGRLMIPKLEAKDLDNVLATPVLDSTTPPNYPSEERPAAIMRDPISGSYAIVTLDGGVFTFGSFPFHGSAAPYVAEDDWIVDAVAGYDGYTLVSDKGAIYNFGSDTYHGRITVT